MPQDWRTVKVFISSTFRDMQAERDHLVRFVFPRLREELLKRRIHLVDVDLRWGVTSEQNVLEVCTQIIDECRPRFLCILGGRYGWTPPGREESITAQEIRYSITHRRDAKEYHFFYFRDPQVTAAILGTGPQAGSYREFPTPEEITGYGQEDAKARARRRAKKLEAIKQEVMDAGYDPFIYPARWDETQQRLVDLKAFGDRVYGDLLWSIDDELGLEAPPELDEFAMENAAMEALVQERAAGYVVGGHHCLLRELTTFAEGEGPPNILVITGAAGSGKSALLAKFYLDYPGTKEKPAHPQDLVIPHFIGASPGSTDLRRTLRRFCHEIYNYCDFEAQKQARLSRIEGDDEEARKKRQVIEEEFSIPEDPQGLLQKFPAFLKHAAADRRVVLLIDAVNQLDAAHNAHAMSWVPQDLPANVRFIASSLEHPALEALKRRGKERVSEKELKPLGSEDRRAIITDFLNRYRKRMSGEQITALLVKEESGNPLYLLTAMEELRTLGTYEEITQRIKDLPERVPELFQWIFQRLEDDPGFQDQQGRPIGKELVRLFFSLLGVSRYGLSQMEMVEFLAPGDFQVKPPIPSDPQGNVAALLRLLHPFLMFRGEHLDFYHVQIREASEAEYLQEEGERWSANCLLVDYFKAKADPTGNLAWKGDSSRGLSELPYHQAQAGKWGDFLDTLTSFSFLHAKASKVSVYSLIDDYNMAPLGQWEEVTGQQNEAGKVLSLLKEALRLSVPVLAEDPEQLGSQLTGRLVGLDIDGIKGFLQKLKEEQTNPWLRPICPSLVSPNGLPVAQIAGHSAAIKDLALTPDNKWAISASADGTIKIWSLSSGQEIRTFTGHSEGVWSVVVTPDNQRVISASKNGNLKVWDLSSGREIHCLNGHFSEVGRLVVTPDNSMAISASSDNTVKVWNPVSGKQLHTLNHGQPVWAVALSRDGQRLVSGSMDYALKIWDLESGLNLHTLMGHKSFIRDVQTTQIFNIGKKKKFLRILKKLAAPGLFGWLRQRVKWTNPFLLFSQSIGLISVIFCGGFYIWLKTHSYPLAIAIGVLFLFLSKLILKFRKYRKAKLFEKQFPDCLDLLSRYIRDGHSIFAAIELAAREMPAPLGSELSIVDKEYNHKNIDFISALCHMADRVESPDLQYLIAQLSLTQRKYLGNMSEILEKLGHAMRERLRLKEKIRPHNLPRRLNGNIAVSASTDQTIRVWDLDRGQELHVLAGHTDSVLAVAVTPDGKKAVSASRDKTLKVWDLESGQELHTLIGHTGSVLTVAVTPDGRRAVSASWDQSIKFWDLESGQLLATYTADHEVEGLDSVNEGIIGGFISYIIWDAHKMILALSDDGMSLVAGDDKGRLHFLRLEGVDQGPAVISAWRRVKEPLWKTWLTKRSSPCAFGCPHCRSWSETLESALGQELPCPKCGKALKLNPFTINADWRPVARAWRVEKD